MADEKDASTPLPPFDKPRHAAHCNRCIGGLPSSLIEIDSSRMAVGFYCLGTMDVLGVLDKKIGATDRESWREWIWGQQAGGDFGSGFRPSPFTNTEDQYEEGSSLRSYTTYSTPHLIMTYCALLSLAILRDDFSKLDREGLRKFIRACQDPNGGFSTVPGADDGDLRMCYCAFAVCSLLDDWEGMDVKRAVEYVQRCRTYEGGYGQSPGGEALGGTTYCALASLYLVPTRISPPNTRLSPAQSAQTIRWLVHNQDEETGGFRGRTNKLADACYCFWCGASLDILGQKDLLDARALAQFFARCQHKYGGVAKAPGESPDPYHTYLSAAMIAITPPSTHDVDPTWMLSTVDSLINSTAETVQWARTYIPAQLGP